MGFTELIFISGWPSLRLPRKGAALYLKLDVVIRQLDPCRRAQTTYGRPDLIQRTNSFPIQPTLPPKTPQHIYCNNGMHPLPHPLPQWSTEAWLPRVAPQAWENIIGQLQHELVCRGTRRSHYGIMKSPSPMPRPGKRIDLGHDCQ